MFQNIKCVQGSLKYNTVKHYAYLPHIYLTFISKHNVATKLQHFKQIKFSEAKLQMSSFVF